MLVYHPIMQWKGLPCDSRSDRARSPPPLSVPSGYSVAKAALHPYCHNLASFYGKDGVNANVIAFGTVGPAVV